MSSNGISNGSFLGMKYVLDEARLSGWGGGVGGDLCRCAIRELVYSSNSKRLPESILCMACPRSDRSSLPLCRCSLLLLAEMPPLRPELCLEGALFSDLLNFFAPVPLRYLVVDWTPSLIAKASRTHSVDFFVSSPDILRSVFLKACDV